MRRAARLLTLSLLVSGAALSGRADTSPALIAALPAGEYAGIDLHSHLFMKTGMTWSFHGDFEEPLQATSWKQGLHSMVNAESLESSRLKIVVATLYAHPLFVRDLRESIRKQIGQAEAFVAAHPDWIIARDATQARAAIAQRKRVLILGLEGAAGILESEEDLKEFVDRRGIRIVTLFHLTDDRFGGVAFLRAFRAVASPWAFLKSLLFPLERDGVRLNPQGLTQDGRVFARMLAARGVWVDLSHASDASQRGLIPILRDAGQPLLYTHTVLRKYHRAERGITSEQLAQVAASRGVLGLVPSEMMLEGTPVPAEMCTNSLSIDSGCDLKCEGGVRALAVQYMEIATVLPPESIDLGSDFNGGIPHLKPGCPLGTALDGEGLWNTGQMPAVWKSLELLGAPVPKPLSKNVDYFLDAWAKVTKR